MKRLDFNESVFEVLKTKFFEQIEMISKNNDTNSKEKILLILEKSFPLVKVESLAPISMCLLKHLKKVILFLNPSVSTKLSFLGSRKVSDHFN